MSTLPIEKMRAGSDRPVQVDPLAPRVVSKDARITLKDAAEGMAWRLFRYFPNDLTPREASSLSRDWQEIAVEIVSERFKMSDAQINEAVEPLVEKYRLPPPTAKALRLRSQAIIDTVFPGAAQQR